MVHTTYLDAVKFSISDKGICFWMTGEIRLGNSLDRCAFKFKIYDVNKHEMTP